MNPLEQSFQDSLDFIYSFVDFSMKRHVDDTHKFFKLDRMKSLMDLLGNPQNQYPCIHVAGTKGKGSVAALCASACQAAGYKVGLYTSPHLEEFTERIQINGVQIDKVSLVRIVEQLRPLTQQIPEVTTFELTTALGFLYFAQNQVDIAVIEVGLGGRLDATNVINPLVSVITPISYDHTAVLGNTLTEIAYEKGGIIKPGIPVVIAPQHAEAQSELIRIVNERKSPTVIVDEVYAYQLLSHSLVFQTVSIQRKQNGQDQARSLASKPLKFELPLLGYHQVQNSVTALAALDVVAQKGFQFSRQTIRSGFKKVSWPARFEILRQDPPVVIDSAHNGDSMLRLRQAIDEYFPTRKFILVFGASADKELDAMFQQILPRIDQVITTQSTHPRAADAEQLAGLIGAYAVPVQAAVPAEEAMQLALQMAGMDKGILITGSIFIAAAARSIWNAEIHKKL
ncbi:MAG: folylpolyglutamate synthase/dihydrofolate synthase family protein [Anaerolineaceae bacterium]